MAESRRATGETIDPVRLRALRQCLHHRQIAVQYRTVDLDYAFSENVPDGWPTASAPGDQYIAERLNLLASAALQGSTSATSQIELRHGGVRRLHEVTCAPDRAADGTLRGVVTVIADITEARQREIALASLLREVSHRSKNLLAIVLSIAAQTANHSTEIEDFLEKFRGRIQALASTQDLVTESNWLGTPFQSLVLAQLSHDGRLRTDGIELLGDNPTLGPNAAMHVGLAIHELLTNALLYGALSTDRPGHIRLGASLEHLRDDEIQLVIDWTEPRPDDTPFAPPHFGTVVLEQVVPRSLGGRARFDVDDDQVHYRLVVPGDQFTV